MIHSLDLDRGWSSVIPIQSLVDAFEMTDGKTIQEAKSAGEYDPANPFKAGMLG